MNDEQRRDQEEMGLTDSGAMAEEYNDEYYEVTDSEGLEAGRETGATHQATDEDRARGGE